MLLEEEIVNVETTANLTQVGQIIDVALNAIILIVLENASLKKNLNW
jgi:hypothetical protein